MVTKRNKPPRMRIYPYSLSGSPYPDWESFEKANRLRDCANPACTAKRHNRGKYCANCSRWYSMLGNPKYRPIHIDQYRKYIDMAMDVIQFNLDNIIVKDFCEKLLTIIDQSKRGLPVEWASWFAGLHKVYNHKHPQHRRDPYKTLAKLVGIYVFYEETRNEFIKSEKMWHYTLGAIMLDGAKTLVKPPATGVRLRKFGKFIWSSFSIYFLKLARATMQNEIHKKVRKEQLEQAELLLPDQEKGECENDVGDD